MVVDTPGGDQFGLYPWSHPLEIGVVKHFMRFKPGWWILHACAVALTLYLGHMVRFKF